MRLRCRCRDYASNRSTIQILTGGRKLTILNFHFDGSDYFRARNAPSMRSYSARSLKRGWHTPPPVATRGIGIMGAAIGTIQISSQFDEK